MAEYIEREAAVEKITNYCELRQAICDNSDDEFLRGLQTALIAIGYNEVIPPADVQPVKRGHWEEISEYGGWGDTYYRCSVCGEEWYLENGTPQQNGLKFCPNCGSDNRGETP